MDGVGDNEEKNRMDCIAVLRERHFLRPGKRS